MTDIISVFRTSPSTTFTIEAELLLQDPNLNASAMRFWIRANNGPGGTTGSNYQGSGRQELSVQATNVPWRFMGQHAGTPFLPSGYPDGAQRWRDGPFDLTIPHDANGNATYEASQRLVYAVDQTNSSGQRGIPRIAKAPGAPQNVRVTNVTPTTVTVAWDPGSRGNADIDLYSPHKATQPNFSDDVFVQVGGGERSYTWTGLTPGTTYYLRVNAHNADGWSDMSATVQTRTLSGFYVSDGSTWKATEAFVSDGSAWKPIEVYVSDGSTWKPAG